MEDEEEQEENEEEQESSTQADASNIVDFQVKILQVGDSDKYSVEFNNVNGDKLVFYQIIQQLRDDLADMANSSA